MLYGFAAGGFYGKSLLHKVAGNSVRVRELVKFVKSEQVDAGISQSSFTSAIAGRLAGVPTIYTNDNEHALGNAWWVDSVAVVAGARAEMSALDSLDVAHVAVTDTAFAQLAAAARDKSPGDTIRLTTYAPNRVTYRAHSAEGGVAVFSEVYFPWGWTVTIDDKPATLSRVNYVLRAMEVPAGDHTIVMKFDPPEVGMTTNIATTAIIVIFLLLLAALNQSVWVAMRRR